MAGLRSALGVGGAAGRDQGPSAPVCTAAVTLGSSEPPRGPPLVLISHHRPSPLWGSVSLQQPQRVTLAPGPLGLWGARSWGPSCSSGPHPQPGQPGLGGQLGDFLGRVAGKGKPEKLGCAEVFRPSQPLASSSPTTLLILMPSGNPPPTHERLPHLDLLFLCFSSLVLLHVCKCSNKCDLVWCIFELYKHGIMFFRTCSIGSGGVLRSLCAAGQACNVLVVTILRVPLRDLAEGPFGVARV